MKPAVAAGFVAVTTLLAAAAALVPKSAASTPALTLRRTLPLPASSLEHLQKLDKQRFTSRRNVPDFDLVGMPCLNFRLYYTLVTLGNPPKNYSVQFDTGSDIMWVTCSPCADCLTPGRIYDTLEVYNPNNSSTSSNISCSDDVCKHAIKSKNSICQASDSPNNQCGYWQEYADGTTTGGYYVSDIMHFDTVMGNGSEGATVSSASVVFGCSDSQSGALQQDGIMGLDDGGGILVLGEVMEPGFVFTPLVSSQSGYSVNMKGISVNGQNVPIDSSLFTTSKTQGTFVDSGTSLAYLPDGVYDPVISAIINAAPLSMNYSVVSGNECFICWQSNVSEFPIVTLYFEGGAPMRVKPANYLVRRGVSHLPDNLVVLCIGFESSKRFKGYEHATILGDFVLRDKIFAYNLEKMHIGWIDYNCSLLNKTNLVIASSESLGSYTPSYCALMIAIGVALINSNIIALQLHNSY
ncbi:aspartic proteinase 36-like [Hordeum vulgare subsp. vulgare]|uniref:aspartic proteinase 36-like n=1 Tax=Hordeum vulgare subsp. vulgare TaxID=112509 RepID=UPI001D1A5257|nr:aspartic proteinase 36-like [Hordeum vulgare subsp. vulgare]